MIINCDTPVSSIISKSDVDPIISRLKDEVDSYAYFITEIIKSEERNGGLSTKAYYVDNKADLNIMANDLLTNLKIVSSFKKCKEEIINSVLVQRNKELDILREEVYNKMCSLRNQYNELYNSNADHNLISEVESEYNYYYSKYNMLEGMI